MSSGTLKDVVARLETYAAFSNPGTSQRLLAALYTCPLVPVVEVRQTTGPIGLKSLDLEAIFQYAWLVYFETLAASKTPVTQVPHSLPRPTSCVVNNAAAESQCHVLIL